MPKETTHLTFLAGFFEEKFGLQIGESVRAGGWASGVV